MANRTLKDYHEIIIKPEYIDGKLEFSDVFGRKSPVQIEIGSGKGTFLLAQATQNPQIDFVGIEWARKYYRLAVDRMGRWEIKNVRMIRTDATFFLNEHISDESVDCFHIYFPDPWPKKRHNKRRFLCSANIDQMARCLKQDGGIKIATDHADYFEQIQQVFKEKKHKFELIPFEPAAGIGQGEFVGTNYERKYIKQERKIYTIAAKKI